MLALFILIPLAAAFVIALTGKLHKRAVECMACAACAVLAVMALFISSKALGAAAPLVFRLGGFMPPFGIPLVVDGLAAFMLVVADLVSLAVAVYSTGYMRRYTDTWKYYALLMIVVAGVNGVILSGDIFNLFVYLEIASIASYALVAFGTEDEALEAAFKYAVMSAVASSFLLLGIGILYSYTSTLNLADMGGMIAAGGSGSLVIRFVSVLFLMGLGLKAALVPFHTWMPDAYTKAPAPVPALSSGVIVKALGVYALTRLFFNVFGMSPRIGAILIGLAVISMVLGSVMAFGQTSLKRLLGYSSISQIGYIFLGLGIGTPLAVTAALFHLLNHSVAKSLLFLNAGEIETVLGTDELRRMTSIARERPVSALTTLAGAFSICGIPPFAGFWSKLLLIIACVQAHRPGLAFIAVAVSMLTIAYYFKVFTPILFGKAREPGVGQPVARQGVAPALVLIALALVALAGGLLLVPGLGRTVVSAAAASVTNGIGYAAVVAGVLQ